FYECHTVKLREHVMDILKDKWAGYKKPFISKNLNEVLLLPDEQPSLKQIESKITDKTEDKFREQRILKEIEKIIKEMPTQKDLKELKDLIEFLKTNKQ
ncbi:23963_t:CDS:1, partial [Gigaspora rosea]